jgi:hypothetical protein
MFVFNFILYFNAQWIITAWNMQFIMGLERKRSYKFCMNVVCECVFSIVNMGTSDILK